MNHFNIQTTVSFANFDFLTSLQKIGYKGLQFSERTCMKEKPDMIDGIANSMQISFHHDHSTSLCSHNGRVIERAKSSIDKALKLKAEYIVFHPGKYIIKNYEGAREDFLNNLLPLLEYCEKENISLVLENNWENLIYDKDGEKTSSYRKSKEINIMGSETEFFDFLLETINNELKINLDFSHLILQGKTESIKSKIRNNEFSLCDENYDSYLNSEEVINDVKKYIDNFLEKFHPYIFSTHVNETDFYDDVNFIPQDGIGLSRYILSKMISHGYNGNYLLEVGSKKPEFFQKYQKWSPLKLYGKSYEFLYTFLKDTFSNSTNCD